MILHSKGKRLNFGIVYFCDEIHNPKVFHFSTNHFLFLTYEVPIRDTIQTIIWHSLKNTDCSGYYFLFKNKELTDTFPIQVSRHIRCVSYIIFLF
jgi:hypothetical protein